MKSTRFVNSVALTNSTAKARAGLQAAWVLLGAGVVLRSADIWNFESAAHLFPPCLFHVVTGIDCPGCGMTRAFLHLSHGDLAGAWTFHPFSPLLASLLLVLAWGPKNAWGWIQHSAASKNVAIVASTLLLFWWGWVKLLPLVGMGSGISSV